MGDRATWRQAGEITMHSSDHRESPSRTQGTPQSEVPGEPTATARRLNIEFGAPVGLFDASSSLWVAKVGAPTVLFPAIGPAVSGPVEGQGRVMIVREDGSDDATWLFLPVNCGSGPLVAAIGFESSLGQHSRKGVLGPCCPEPALRAWGQSIATMLREQAASHSPSASSKSAPRHS